MRREAQGYIELEPGLIVSELDGEIIECPDGGDPLLLVVHSLALARQQRDAWDSAGHAASRAIIRGQEGKSAVYGDWRVVVVSPERDVTDWAAVRMEWQAQELTREQLYQIAFAARSFDPALLPLELGIAIAGHTVSVPIAQSVRLYPVRRFAPPLVERPEQTEEVA